MTILLFAASFLFVALAAQQIGKLVTNIRLPLVTGYLISGAIAGPFILDLITEEAVHDLRFIDELSLGMIAFTAGSELYLAELRSRLRSILILLSSLTITIYVLGTIAFFLLADFIPFMQEMNTISRFGIALLAGSILVARSPSSAIAVINELRAKGPYTKLVLGVTVAMDIVVIIIFSISLSIADAFLTDVGIDLEFVQLLVLELGSAGILGYLYGRVLIRIVNTSWHAYVKITLIALVGLSIFVLSTEIRHWSHDNFQFEILLEPLLIGLIASIVVTNFSKQRVEFTELLHKAGPLVYIAFFTLTGASLALNLVFEVWTIMVIIFVVRLTGIIIGSYTGTILANEPQKYRRIAWMSFVTQAGVGLGLAREVAVQFPEWGNEFATLIISVIVVNEIVGPPLFKASLKRVGESHLPGIAQPDTIRDVLILGINTQSLTLARQLFTHDWQVTLADMDVTTVEQAQRTINSESNSAIALRHLSALTEEHLSTMITSATDAIVAMLPNDANNYKACELAYERFGVPRQIVQINEPSWSKQFHNLGVRVVDPTSAMVNVLDQCVRSPQSAELLLSEESEYDTVQVTIIDKDVVGLSMRDLVLPDDVLVLGIRRKDQWILPHGHTTLRWNDEVTFIGKPLSLVEITRRFGY